MFDAMFDLRFGSLEVRGQEDDQQCHGRCGGRDEDGVSVGRLST